MEARCIVGLGNPGPQYEHTRHNIGFMVVDHLSSRAQIGTTSGWKAKFEAEWCDHLIAGEKVKLVKPQSFMNLSGEPLREILRFFKIEPQEVAVVHDDVDLPFGSLKLKRGGGDGGHNGLKSITACLGTREYLRVRMGVGRPNFEPAQTAAAEMQKKPGNKLSGWVLGSFGDDEIKVMSAFLDLGGDTLEVLCREGLKAAQAEFHSKSVKPG